MRAQRRGRRGGRIPLGSRISLSGGWPPEGGSSGGDLEGTAGQLPGGRPIRARSASTFRSASCRGQPSRSDQGCMRFRKIVRLDPAKARLSTDAAARGTSAPPVCPHTDPSARAPPRTHARMSSSAICGRRATRHPCQPATGRLCWPHGRCQSTRHPSDGCGRDAPLLRTQRHVLRPRVEPHGQNPEQRRQRRREADLDAGSNLIRFGRARLVGDMVEEGTTGSSRPCVREVVVALLPEAPAKPRPGQPPRA